MLSILETDIGCQNVTTKGSDYNGTASMPTCQKWSGSALYSHLGDHSYCRNPDGDSAVWCYSHLENAYWEYCNVPVCQG